MNDLPDTIKYPDSFNKSKPAGFDGVFDWAWTSGCFGETKITPMDFDGVVERRGHYLVMETKDPGREIPKGQQITLDGLPKAKSFTVVKIWGKKKPQKAEILYPNGETETVIGEEAIRNLVETWYQRADSGEIKRSREDW
jgi:hypothetical protein